MSTLYRGGYVVDDDGATVRLESSGLVVSGVHADAILRHHREGEARRAAWEERQAEAAEAPVRDQGEPTYAEWVAIMESPEWPDMVEQWRENEAWNREVARMNEAREDPARDPELRQVQMRFDTFEAGHMNGGRP